MCSIVDRPIIVFLSHLCKISHLSKICLIRDDRVLVA